MIGNCEGCGAAKPRVHIDGAVLCDRCADRLTARLTGLPELPEPPPPFTLTGPDGIDHVFRIRLQRAPTGVIVELEETGVPDGSGWQFSVLGAHDGSVDELIAQVRALAEREMAVRFLDVNPHRPGWILRGEEVAGRLVWDEETGAGGPYGVVVDGQTLSWEELGRALEPFEGWRFRLRIEARCLDARPDADVIPLVDRGGGQADAVDDEAVSPSIDQVLEGFLADQESRLAPRTFRRYAEVISLLRDCLNGYGHQSLDDVERRRFDDAYDRDPDAFVHLFGPSKIVENLGEFLGYFMIRKVMGGEELMRAAGTVTKKLAAWLGEHGHLDPDTVEIAIDRGSEAVWELPMAERLSRLLSEESLRTTIDVNALDDDEYLEDFLMIERVEPGRLWFEGGIGPVKVSRETSDVAQEGWSVNIVLGRQSGGWRVLEVGSVYP